MDVPSGYCELIIGNIVCKLKKECICAKAITTSMIWKIYQSYGRSKLQIKSMRSYYIYQILWDKGVAVLLVYMDGIILTCDSEKEHQLLNNHLTKEFEIKTLG